MSDNPVSERIGLGTVQFGVDYGITNNNGRVPEEEVTRILRFASASGISLIDTAHVYGESEAVLGRAMPPAIKFSIVTKLPALSVASSAEEASRILRKSFEKSLRKLCTPKVYGLLFHAPADLLGEYGDLLWQEASALKTDGLVKKLGLSVYEGHEIDAALDRFPVELIQIPFNLFDRRFVEGGQIERLSAKNVEIHARSIFLQGLLLARNDAIPHQFAPLRNALIDLRRQFADQNVDELEGILALTYKESRIGKFIFGITSIGQLEAILGASKKAQETAQWLNIDPLPELDPRILNPARWKELLSA